MSIVKTEFSVNKTLAELYSNLQTNYKEMGIDHLLLELELPPDKKKYCLFTDSTRFLQIMNNLLNNAMKYTEKGHIRFGFIPLFDSDYDKEPSMLQFFVEDTGIGISTEKSEFIFEEFNKIETDNTKVYRGAGLGLYISKQLINLMGGRIWFHSKLNAGTTFYFTLPYLNISEFPPARKKKSAIEKKKSVEQYDWRNKTVLIVEDEQNNIIYLSEIIRRTGARILEAKTGIQAIEQVEKNDTISLVLMDLMMPEMDGYKATRKIKNIRANLPVIAQTAYTKSREKEKSLEAGCDGYISKPYDPPELLKLINTFL
jgi:CheY-like chemotaxis protein